MPASPTGTCHYCGGPAETWDHVIPRALGGPDQIWNRVPSCQRCNQRKGSITYENFTGSPYLPDKCGHAGWNSTQRWLDAHPEVAVERRKRTELLAAEKAKLRGVNHPAYVGPTPPEVVAQDSIAAIARQFCLHALELGAQGACPACKHKVLLGLKLTNSRIVPAL